MLSKSATQNLVRCVRQFQVPAAYSSSSVSKTENSERDLINFPKLKRLETNPPTVFNLIPKSWFDFMYPKTGVTGPYMLLAGLGTYILSKEILVINPETIVGIAYIGGVVTLHKLYGHKLKETLHKMQDENDKKLNASQEEEKMNVRECIAANEKALWEAEGASKYLMEAKRENIYLQMEAAYRARLEQAFVKVKRYLDYQVEKQNIERQIAQKNMVDYILRNVEKSITPQLKKNALKQCLGDLKSLAAKA